MAEVSLHILNRSGSGIAPEGIFFEARIRDFDSRETLDARAYDPSFHELRYHWVIHPEGAAPAPRRSARLANLPLAHNDSATAYGKRVGHVFDAPGRYVVRCEVRDDEGVTAEAALTVTVGDPDPAFPGPATILVDPSGRGDPAYRGAQITGDVARAFDLANRLGAPARILLARGRVHEAARITLRGHPSIWLGAFGDGPAPVIAARERFMLVRAEFQGELRITGISFQSFWDSTTETGTRADCIVFHVRDTPSYTLIGDCDFAGWSTALFAAKDQPESGLPIATYLHDISVTNWGDYGLYMPLGPGAFWSMTACAVAQHPHALMGGPKDAEHNHHGPLRLAWPGHAYIAVCDMFSRNGWSPNRNLPSEQPCIRWNTSMRAGTSGVIERVAMEGGEQNLIAMNAGVPPQHYLTNLVVEKCLMVGNATTFRHVTTHTTGLTIRNVLAIKPNRPPVTSRWHEFFRAIHHEDFVFLDPDAPIRAYSNTVVTLLDDTNRTERELGLVVGIEDFEVFSDENNVLIAPNSVYPSEDNGRAPQAIETIAGRWRPRYLGVRYQPSRITQGQGIYEMRTSYGTPDDGAVGLYLPSASSDLARTAMGTVAIDDFFGRIRPDEPSRGAFEPEA